MPWLLATAAAAVLVSLIGLELVTYTTWGTTEPSAGPPGRIQWCGRRYLPGHHTMTLSEVSGQIAQVAPGRSLVQVATAPSGYAVMTVPMTSEQRAAYHTDVCAMVLYVRLGQDSYLPHGLSGGP